MGVKRSMQRIEALEKRVNIDNPPDQLIIYDSHEDADELAREFHSLYPGYACILLPKKEELE